MNRLDSTTRSQVIHSLIEGCSIRATVRMTGVAKKTIMRLLIEVGEVCADYQDHVFRNLQSKRLQLDEMWSWIYCKDRNRTEEIARKNPDAGDVWLWVAVDADSKLVPSWRLGQRDLVTATDFVNDLAKRVRGRVQIYAPLYAALEWIQPQARESCGCCCSQLFCLQLHQDSSYTADKPGYGRWRYGSAVERGRPSDPLGSLRTAEGGKSSMILVYEIVGYLLLAGFAYCAWRLLLLGAAWRDKWRAGTLGKPEPPISIFNDNNSK